jgi:hypothetical protein
MIFQRKKMSRWRTAFRRADYGRGVSKELPMTSLQVRMAQNAVLNADRFARAAARRAASVAPAASPASDLLVRLRRVVESTDEMGDGSRWGHVYLPNVGSGHSFAGLLSSLEGQGFYKPTGDRHFGMVKLA